MRKPALWLMLLLVTSGAGLAAVYKWVDEQGKTHFSDQPPAERQAEPVALDEQPHAPPPSPGLRDAEREFLDERAQDKAAEHQRQAEQAMQRVVAPRSVSGSIVLDLRVHEDATLPRSTMQATLIVVPAGGQAIRYRPSAGERDWSEWRNKSPERARALATFNFVLELAPGDYRLDALEVDAPELADQPFRLPLDAGVRVSEEADCVYLGRGMFRYVRLPSGNRSAQRKDLAAAEQRLGRISAFIYLKEGGLGLWQRSFDAKPAENAARSLIRKSREPYDRAVAAGCEMAPARF